MLDLLVVDDEPTILEIMASALRRQGHRVALAPDGAAALEAASGHAYDAIICDVQMPEIDGLTVLKRLRDQAPATAVILMTAHGGTKEAVRALRYGATDYLTKPFSIGDLLERLSRLPALKTAIPVPAGEPVHPPSELLGESELMQQLRAQIEKLADCDVPVAIVGESGTGKELVARALHARSARRTRPFVTFNCARSPPEALEAALFGADEHGGALHAAEGGTLLLDEVGELPRITQPKLLRILETTAPDVRIVSATHRWLLDMVRQGRFREDLHTWLKVLELEVPPLRERTGDITLLSAHFLQRFAAARSPTGLSAAARSSLERHAWPGNVRELELVMRQAAVLAAGKDEVLLEHLPPEISGEVAPGYEQAVMRRALALANGNQTAAAALLGLTGPALWEKLRRHRLEEAGQNATA